MNWATFFSKNSWYNKLTILHPLLHVIFVTYISTFHTEIDCCDGSWTRHNSSLWLNIFLEVLSFLRFSSSSRARGSSIAQTLQLKSTLWQWSCYDDSRWWNHRMWGILNPLVLNDIFRGDCFLDLMFSLLAAMIPSETLFRFWDSKWMYELVNLL